VLASTAATATAAVVFAARAVTTYTTDSYYYLGKARSLARLGPFEPGFGGFDRKFFPGYSIALAPFVKVLGEPGWLVLNILALLATLAVTHRLGERLGLPPLASAVGAALGVLAPAVIQWTALPMSEPLAALLIASFLLARLRACETGLTRDALAAAVLYGLAAVTRAEAVPLGALLVVDVMTNPKLRRARVGGPMLVAAALLPALYVLSLVAHRTDGGAVTRYSNEIKDHGIPLWKLPVRFVYHLGAAFDLRFEHAIPVAVQAFVGAVRVLATAAALAAMTRVRRSAVARTLLPPVVVGAAIHAAWFYQYERFAFLWTPEIGLLVAWLVVTYVRPAERPALAQRRSALALVVVVALLDCAVAGALEGRPHAVDLAAHTDTPRGRELAPLFRDDSRCAAGVVMHPDPELAYLVDLPVWFAGDKELFVRSDVAPGGLPALLARTGTRCLATTEEPHAWAARWGLMLGADAIVDGPAPPYRIILPARSR